jgi:uncharacterized protein YggU (UPF0235/DUF167 family)
LAEAAWSATPDGLILRVRVTPRGGRDVLDGVEALSDGRQVVRIRVRAAPEDGAANEAVRRLVAKALGRPASAVSLRAGATARVKALFVSGDPAALSAALSGLFGDPA